MPDIVSRNTIKLSNTASAVNNAYKGYVIIVSRYDPVTGKQLEQTKEIIAYDGPNKIATINGIWDADFIPDITDTYIIVPMYGDARVTINPAMQTLDYIMSVRYGKGLNIRKDIDLPSWKEGGRSCDTQSDVTVKMSTDVSTIQIGGIYAYVSTYFHWQGTVKSKKPGYVTFTNCIGKLANKWNSWKSYKQEALVYDEGRLYYAANNGVKPTKPSHTSGSVGGLVAITGTFPMYRQGGPGPDVIYGLGSNGNPVGDVNANGTPISGYSLYDADGVDYWRYLGWDQHDQRYVTRHQTNLMVDTSVPIFDNINSFLEHFGGIMRYTGGKYQLEVEQGEEQIPTYANEPRNIDAKNILGRIRLGDEGVRGSFNSLTVAYADPANKFEAKNISFFNSEFLKIDRNVPKKGNLSIPGVTNYYNARLLADKFLIKSRFGLTVSFNMEPRGILLMAGKVIQLQHPRYDWSNKKFRIENLTHNSDASVDIVAKEYDDKMYSVSNVSRPPAAALAGEPATATNISPSGLHATNIDSNDETVGGIELTWNNSPGMDSTVSTEIFGSRNANLFCTVIGITSNLLGTAEPHGLQVGDTVTSQSAYNGLEFGKTYFVKTVPSSYTFTISENQGGPTKALQNGSGLSEKIMTASIVATVSPPINSYIDVIPGQGTERIQKHYWIRHKITQQ